MEFGRAVLVVSYLIVGEDCSSFTMRTMVDRIWTDWVAGYILGLSLLPSTSTSTSKSTSTVTGIRRRVIIDDETIKLFIRPSCTWFDTTCLFGFVGAAFGQALFRTLPLYLLTGVPTSHIIGNFAV